ncbi:tRNA (guanine(9)-N(1))-methyltransferase [Myotisia sp. PD_48]|nr:tRNA (guanine(9)-N(1))-methyltransferase [Myotisia sp. PD_48]
MDAEERPKKLQKLDHETHTPISEKNLSNLDSAAEAPSNNEPNPTEGNGREDNLELETGGGNDIDATESANGHSDTQKLSKNQLKKLLKKQRWDAGKDERKALRKQKIQAKKERNRAARAQLSEQTDEHGTPQAADSIDGLSLHGHKRNIAARARAVRLPITFLIDCDFDDLMADKERKSLGAQITRIYSDNSKAPFRANLVLCSFGGHLKERFDTTLGKQYVNWKGVKFTDEDFSTSGQDAQSYMKEIRKPNLEGMFASKKDQDLDSLKEKGEVVYLTSDSPDTLMELNPYSTYIVGGIVDKNRHKGICYQRATEKGLKTGKLPIGEYMEMASRYVLTTNHVVEIMLKWLELGDWGQAFAAVIPKRKGGKLKQSSGGDEQTIPNDDEPDNTQQNNESDDDDDNDIVTQ